MSSQRKSIYEYDKEYYENLTSYYVDGSNAKVAYFDVQKSNNAVDYEEALDYYDTEALESPIRKPKKAPIPKAKPQIKKKVRRKSDFDVVAYFFLVAAMAVTLMFCISFLQTKSDINELSKQRKILTKDLIALKDANDSLEAQLNATIDYDYLYAYAVGKLGMIYPNKEQIINYQNDDFAYVIQYEQIPQVESELTFNSLTR